MKKTLCLLLVVVMAIGLLAGCGGSSSSAPASSGATAFKIGGTGPLTGGAAI